MVDKRTIKSQLAAIDASLPFWVKPEMNQLTKIIVPGEKIRHIISGRYGGGTALLCATDLRLLIIDKKPMFLAVEDVRYDMIAEVNYTHQFFDASIHLAAFNKDFSFTSFRKDELHDITEHIQQKLSEVRQHSPEETGLMAHVLNTQQDGISSDQARELLPNTPMAWDRISEKLDTINGVNPTPLIRRRVTKFDTFQ